MLKAMPPARLNRRPQGHASLPAWYRALLTEHEASRLSLAEFAEVAGVSAASLARWRRRLGRADSSDPRPHRLVEVRVAKAGPTHSQRAAATFTVHLPGDRRIEVGHGFDAAELGRLVEALEAC